jgi:Na+-driven multidrug efflux pump
VSNELGAGHPKSASFSVLVVTSCLFVVSVIAAIIVLIFRDSISYIFTEAEVVAKAALLPFITTIITINIINIINITIITISKAIIIIITISHLSQTFLNLS